jgi:hypothetical protein
MGIDGMMREDARVRTRLGSRPRERWRAERVAMDLRRRVEEGVCGVGVGPRPEARMRLE